MNRPIGQKVLYKGRPHTVTGNPSHRTASIRPDDPRPDEQMDMGPDHPPYVHEKIVPHQDCVAYGA